MTDGTFKGNVGKIPTARGHHITPKQLLGKRSPHLEFYMGLRQIDPTTGRAYFDVGNRSDNVIHLAPKQADGSQTLHGRPTHNSNHPAYSSFAADHVAEKVQDTFEMNGGRLNTETGKFEGPPAAWRAAGKLQTAYNNSLKKLLLGGINASTLSGDLRLDGDGATTIFDKSKHQQLDTLLRADPSFKLGQQGKVLDVSTIGPKGKYSALFDPMKFGELTQAQRDQLLADFKSDLNKAHLKTGPGPATLRSQTDLLDVERKAGVFSAHRGTAAGLGKIGAAAIAGTIASGLLILSTREAEARGVTLAEVLQDLDINEQTLKNLIAAAGADIAISSALSASPLALLVVAKKLYELLQSGEDVISAIKIWESVLPNSEALKALGAIARAVDNSAIFKGLSTTREAISEAIADLLGANDGKLRKSAETPLNDPVTRSITDALAGDTRVESQTGALGHVFPNGTRGTSKWTRLKNGTSIQELRDKNGLLLQRNYWKGGQKALSEAPDPENPGTSRITTFDNGEPTHTGTLGPSGGTSSQPVPRPDSAPVEPPKSLDDFLDALPNRGPDGKLKWDWSTAELIPQVNLPSGDPPPALPAGLPAPYRVKDSSGKVTREVTPLPSRDPGETRYRETIKGPKGEVRIDRIEPAGPQFDPNGAIPPLPVQAPRIEQFDLKVPGAPPEQLHSSVTYKSVRMGLGGPVGILCERDVNNGVPGEWKTTVTPAAPQPKQIPLISLEPAGGDITGSAVGSIFGSSLGQAIGGKNVFAQVLAGSALATALSSFAGGFGTTTTVDSVTLAISSADHISTAFAQNLAGQGIGAVSAFLTAELAEGLGIDTADFGGKLFSFVANTATNTLLKTAIVNVIGKNPILQGFSGRLFQFGIQSSAVFTNVSVGAFIGSYLGSQIVQPQNIAGSIGASALSSVGSLIGASQAVLNAVAAAIGAVGSAVATAVLSFVLPVIGSLIGYVFGAKIGNWLNRKFGIGADQGDGIYEVRLAAGSTATPSGHLIVNNDEDFGLPARELHQATIDILESLLPRIGAGATNAVTIRYQISAQGHDGADPRVKRRNYVTVSGVEGAGEYRNEEDVGALLGYGVHFALKGLDLNNARALRVANQHSDRNVTRQLCHVQVKQPDASSIAIDRKLNKIVTITSALSVLDAGPRNTRHNGPNELRPPHRCFRDSSHSVQTTSDIVLPPSCSITGGFQASTRQNLRYVARRDCMRA